MIENEVIKDLAIADVCVDDIRDGLKEILDATCKTNNGPCGHTWDSCNLRESRSCDVYFNVLMGSMMLRDVKRAVLEALVSIIGYSEGEV